MNVMQLRRVGRIMALKQCMWQWSGKWSLAQLPHGARQPGMADCSQVVAADLSLKADQPGAMRACIVQVLQSQIAALLQRLFRCLRKPNMCPLSQPLCQSHVSRHFSMHHAIARFSSQIGM